MLLRRALPDARQKTARPLPIYEMGSSIFENALMAMLRQSFHELSIATRGRGLYAVHRYEVDSWVAKNNFQKWPRHATLAAHLRPRC